MKIRVCEDESREREVGREKPARKKTTISKRTKNCLQTNKNKSERVEETSLFEEEKKEPRHGLNRKHLRHQKRILHMRKHFRIYLINAALRKWPAFPPNGSETIELNF